MRRTLTALAVVIALGPAAIADEKPTESYQKAMRAIGDAMQSVRAASKDIEESGAGAQDYMAFEDVVPVMKTSFATTVAFWQAKKIDDAVRFAQAGAKQVADLEAAAKERDYRMVLDAVTSLTGTCAACHMEHRVRFEDGSFGIK